jgi:PTH1 family peptidyl-tRNA hydrolase
VGLEKVLLLCPLTYMNRSGTSVQQARDFYKLDEQDLIVVCDDYHLPVAKLRFRSKGSSGGQKGLADIIRKLGTEEFPRLRIGVGEPPPRWNTADFVLSRFSDKEERKQIDDAVRRASQALVEWVERGIEHCMNQYNG